MIDFSPKKKWSPREARSVMAMTECEKGTIEFYYKGKEVQHIGLTSVMNALNNRMIQSYAEIYYFSGPSYKVNGDSDVLDIHYCPKGKKVLENLGYILD